jgi:signal transduction histidine kinase
MTQTISPMAAAAAQDSSARSFRRSILVLLGLGLAALVVMAAVAIWLVARAQDYNRWTDHTYKVENDINHLSAILEQTETARRGFLLVPNATYQKIYQTETAAVDPQVDRIANDSADNPIQRQNIVLLRALIQARNARVNQVMVLAEAGRAEAAIAAFKQDRDHPILKPIRERLANMLGEEQRLLILRTAREQDNANILLWVVLIGGSLLAALSVGAMLLMRRYADELDQAQSELRALNVELEGRVKARTSELSRANEEIQRFAYIVSHDLRSPLVNVMGFTSELEVALKPLKRVVDWMLANAPDRLPKDVRESVEVEMPEAIGFIRSSTRKMDGLINAILRLSREGRRTLTAEPIVMSAVAKGLIDNVQHRLSERGAEAQVEGDLPDLVSDRLAIEQVFGNLIDNAVKYLSPSRPGRIVLRGWREGGLVIYEIEDNGRGVAPQDHERIFELFRRAGAQDQAGEGIGLAHVRALMYRLGGTITCTSELDRGATFRLSFPPELHSDRS